MVIIGSDFWSTIYAQVVQQTPPMGMPRDINSGHAQIKNCPSAFIIWHQPINISHSLVKQGVHGGGGGCMPKLCCGVVEKGKSLAPTS